MVEFEPGVFGGETPINDCSALITLVLQGFDSLPEGFFNGIAAAQDTAGEHAQLDLCHVEPTAMFGGVVKVEFG